MEELFIRCFEESNDWEGETWSFFIKGTEKQFNHLKEIIATDDTPYTLSDKIFSENEVKVLVENADYGYMDSDNDFGILKDTIFEVTTESLEDDDIFYKGGIGKYTEGRILN